MTHSCGGLVPESVRQLERELVKDGWRSLGYAFRSDSDGNRSFEVNFDRSGFESITVKMAGR